LSIANLEELERRLGYSFRDRSLLRQGLTHSSYLHENPGFADPGDNERLEFLGDAVLGLAAGHLLYETHPSIGPGSLSRLRAAIVNQTVLAGLAREIGIADLLLLGHGEETSGGREKPSILAGAYEAVLGAVYLDGGFEVATALARGHLSDLSPENADYKTALQEACQRIFRQTPTYRVEGESGPAHRKTFRVGVWLGQRRLAFGEGGSKKEAESMAAREALEAMEDCSEEDPGKGREGGPGL